MTEELPGMPPANTPRAGSRAWKVAEFKRFRALCEQEGGLTMPIVAALMVGVSRQRIHQLIESGHLRGFNVFGRNYVSCNGLEAFLELERDASFRYGEQLA